MAIPFVLLNPPADLHEVDVASTESLFLGYLIAVLRASQIPFYSMDMNIEKASKESVIQKIAIQSPKAVILLLMYRNLRNGLEIAREIKNFPNPPMVIGCGYAATISAHQLIKQELNIDALIIGEAEETLLEVAKSFLKEVTIEDVSGLLLRKSNGQVLSTSPRSLVNPLDKLPFPARDYLPISLEVASSVEVLTSRGCYGNCSFCNIPLLQANNIGDRWRGRSPENVIEEIIHLYEDYNIRYIEFADENFIGPGEKGKSRASAIAKGILKHRIPVEFSIYCRADDIDKDLFQSLKEAGLRSVNIGFESANKRLLDRFKKNIKLDIFERSISILKSLSLYIIPSFIMFEPTISLDELRANLKFLYDHQLFSTITPTSVIPFHDTPLTRLLDSEGLLSQDRYILKPYISEVDYADKRVLEVKNLWENWQKNINRDYSRLFMILNIFYDNIVIKNEIPVNAELQRALVNGFECLKTLEYKTVNHFISSIEQDRQIQEKFTKQISFLSSLESQILAALHEQPLVARYLGVV